MNPMTLIRETFVRDPLKTTLPNAGVAKVTAPTTDEEWSVLKWELSTFVCEGEYHSGLRRVLSSYLTCLDRETQPAVWISGFFGCGKSHFARVLEYLWRDLQLPDGASPRGLVDLPEEIAELLIELSTAGRREGGLWSAAGTVSGGEASYVRAALLGIIFKSAGLPTRIPQAEFVLWARQEGIHDPLSGSLAASNRNLYHELRNMYVSTPLSEALLEADTNFASDVKQAKVQLKEQFPNRADVSTEEMVNLIEQVLRMSSTDPKKLPCTMIVLDETQQYIGTDSERALHVQEAVEACCSRFGSHIQFVATGQSALAASPQLSRLRDRFTIPVELSDSDVEKVIRKVVLRKQPDKVSALKAMLGECSGEIDRHLTGTTLGPRNEDRLNLVSDYPLLPVRRRFWERVLRAVDRAGTAAQLRTQLRMVHEAARAAAELPLGTVIGADFVYDQQEISMLQSGVLLPEKAGIIKQMRDGTEDGDLKSRLCALIFLIGQLPSDLKLTANTDTLADLVVTDLRAGSGAARQRIPELLQGLIERGDLMQVGDQYRLQTREGSEWEQDYRTTLAKIRGNDATMAADRTEALQAALSGVLKGVKLLHGESKTPRALQMHYSEELPSVDSGAIPLWIRDEWTTPEKSVRNDAQQAGTDDPTLCVFLPRRGHDALREQLAGAAAAKEVLERRGIPTSDEGKEARIGMETRQRQHEGRVEKLVQEVLDEAAVYQGGGNRVDGVDLESAVRTGAEASLSRLFPRFKDADSSKWARVMSRAREGNPDALQIVGHAGEPHNHPVSQELIRYVGVSGRKGIEIRKDLAAPPYGWPVDAIHAVLCVLTASGHLRATRDGKPVAAVELDQTRISQTDFRSETVTLSAKDRIALRKLFQEAGIPVQPGEEGTGGVAYLQKMQELAQSAGGVSPLPPKPNTMLLEDLRSKTGNEQLAGILGNAEQLAANAPEWMNLAEKTRKRLPQWEDLQKLLHQARSLPVHDTVSTQANALQEQRSLLSEDDPIQPLLSDIEDALRAALKQSKDAYDKAYQDKAKVLAESDSWQRLSSDQQEEVRRSCSIQPADAIKMSTRQELLNTLDAVPLAHWASHQAALTERVTQALAMAAKLLEPKAQQVTPPHAEIRSPEEARDYTKKLEGIILDHLKDGPVVV